MDGPVGNPKIRVAHRTSPITLFGDLSIRDAMRALWKNGIIPA